MLRVFAGRLLNRLRERVGWAVPSNYGRIRADAARIDADVRYAVQVARAYAGWLPGGFARLQGRSVLEIGPGNNFGVALVLKCAGAGRVAVTDRFLARYQEKYHGPLYRAMRKAVAAAFPALDLAPFDGFVAAGTHASGAVECIEMPLERCAERHAGDFDLVLSNAVLEHVYDPAQAAKSLFAILAPGGKGYHQVDFRDHRDNTRPLEYLLLSERDFDAQLQRTHCDYGNRFRPHELEAHLRSAGFAHPVMHVDMRVPQDYMDSFLPRLRAARHSPYCSMDTSLLEVIGARFELMR
jgi:SAM-dependent methyltransferase